MSTIHPYSDEKEYTALSRELSEFLVIFSIAAHRCAMYPADHPSLLPAVEGVVAALDDLLQTRDSLSLGVTQRQLVIDDSASDERNPVLADLARRLHSHQLGAVVFSRGLTREEFSHFLGMVAEEPERGGKALGLLPDGLRVSWNHIALRAIGYDQLELAGTAGRKGKSSQLWLQLARSALGVRVDEKNLPGIAALAAILRERGNDPAYDRAIIGYLLQLAGELKGAGGEEADEVRRKVSDLIREIDDDTLHRMIRMGGGWMERKRLLLDGSRGGLAIDTVVRLLHVVATQEERTLSAPLSRILTKLSLQAEVGGKGIEEGAARALREKIDRLVQGWEEGDPSPAAYAQTLDRLSYASPVFALDPQGGTVPGAERILQTALEVDAFGPTVQRALGDLLDQGLVPRVLRMVDRAPPGSKVAERLRSHLMTPVQLRRLLSGDDVDEESLRLLVARIGPKAIDPLFQFLTESESHAIRRKVFDALTSMTAGGDAVAAMAVARLRDERWFVKRNMLALLQKVEKIPPEFTPVPFLQYHDSRVRREAFGVAFRIPTARDRALSLALTDADERIVRMALLEVSGSPPEAVVRTIATRILAGDTFPTLRGLAVRSLEEATSPMALETLLGTCSAGKTIFGRPRLAPKSPELVAAIAILARRWRNDPRVQPILALAGKSQDLQIAGAARGGDFPE